MHVVQSDGRPSTGPTDHHARHRDGAIGVQLVGEPAAVGEVVDALPGAIDAAVHEVGELGVARSFDVAAALSDRQREAVVAALERGYYDQPRRATNEDVAEALECAPSTASECLQKAKAKLVRAAMRKQTNESVLDEA